MRGYLCCLFIFVPITATKHTYVPNHEKAAKALLACQLYTADLDPKVLAKALQEASKRSLHCQGVIRRLAQTDESKKKKLGKRLLLLLQQTACLEPLDEGVMKELASARTHQDYMLGERSEQLYQATKKVMMLRKKLQAPETFKEKKEVGQRASLLLHTMHELVLIKNDECQQKLTAQKSNERKWVLIIGSITIPTAFFVGGFLLC